MKLEFKMVVNEKKVEQVRSALQTLLAGTICNITFDKVDGTESKMKCTLIPSKLPPKVAKEGKETKEKKESMETLPVFKLDGEKSGWRSFRVDGLKEIEVLYDS